MKINAINNTYADTKSHLNKNAKNRNNSTPSFKGAGTEHFSNFYEKLASTKGYQGFVNKISHSNNTFTHLLVAESCLLSGFYMINTLRNPKIKKEQKPQMLINDTLTLGISTAGAYLVEDEISDAVVRGSEKYFAKHADFYTKLGKQAEQTIPVAPREELAAKVVEVASKTGEGLVKGAEEVASTVAHHLKNITGEEGVKKAFQVSGDEIKAVTESVKEAVVNNAGDTKKAAETVKGLTEKLYDKSAARAEADKLMPGINKLKVLVVFGLIYRYLGPVVITPISNKLSKKLVGNKKDEAKAGETNAKK